MGDDQPVPGPIRRLAEELAELHPDIGSSVSNPRAVIEELHYALRPPVHERRVPSYGAIVCPRTELSSWADAIGLEVSSKRVEELRDTTVRRLADGIVSWAIRGPDAVDDLVVFDRSVGSERDLTILAGVTGAVIVQRHPSGTVRAIGRFGVLRHEGITWHLQPPVDQWLDRSKLPAIVPGVDSGRADRCPTGLPDGVFDQLLRFAVHDVAARRIGATLVVAPGGRLAPGTEQRLGRPPDLRIGRPADLAPLYHVLGQLDGAAVFDERGRLCHLGVRFIPSNEADSVVEPYRGTRHTSAIRYSFDDPEAVVVVISEDGPISVVHGGELIGVSTRLLGPLDPSPSRSPGP